mmetsp:Transcript_21824/g.65271  ORF Transcript_21824/g.65271 Transcript_21824/m.65271 type:complete len:272 (+) Transcript_21824:1737-2552(+)
MRRACMLPSEGHVPGTAQCALPVRWPLAKGPFGEAAVHLTYAAAALSLSSRREGGGGEKRRPHASPLLRVRHQQPAGVGADAHKVTKRAELPADARVEARARVGVLGILGALVDGLPRQRADVKRVARVVVDLDRVGRRLLARRKHAAHLLRNLGPRVELQQAAAEAGARRAVAGLEEDGHGGAQRQRQVHRLQLAVCEERRELERCRRLLAGAQLLAPQLAPQRDVVLAADAQQLLNIVDLLAGGHDGERDDVQHAREGLERVGELALSY